MCSLRYVLLLCNACSLRYVLLLCNATKTWSGDAKKRRTSKNRKKNTRPTGGRGPTTYRERERVDHDVDQFRSSWLSPRVDHRRIRHNDIHQRQKPSRSFAASRYISPRRRRSPPGLLVLSHKVPVHVHEDVPDHDLKITQTIFDLPIPQKT